MFVNIMESLLRDPQQKVLLGDRQLHLVLFLRALKVDDQTEVVTEFIDQTLECGDESSLPQLDTRQPADDPAGFDNALP